MEPMILLLSTALALDTSAWSFAAGGQIEASSHGVLDLAWRRGPWSAGLYTDTLELRWAPEDREGRAWLALRGEGGAAGLVSTVWHAGAPAPEQSYLGHYVGVDGGRLVYGPGGLYGGAQLQGRQYLFGPTDATTVEVPSPTFLLSGDALLGWWRPFASAWLRLGLDWSSREAQLSPHAHLEARSTLSGRVVPRLELRAGLSQDADAMALARLGGLTPYGVPLAGAGWFEFWAEDYAALRAGPELQVGSVRAAAVWDGAFFHDPREETDRAAGMGLLLGARRGRWWGELSGGYGAWVPRAEGVSPASVWFRVGADAYTVHGVAE